jgi:two-component system sensor histidine kinase RegB
MTSVCSADSQEYAAHLRRLVASRWLVLAGMTLFAAVAPALLDVPLPQAPLLGILAIAGVFNALAYWRTSNTTTAAPQELLSQLLFDIGTLSAIVFFSGGAANPLVSLLLPPVAIGALTLPGRMAAIVGAIAVGAYSLLMLFYLPLPMADASRATKLHLLGMWLIFVISAAMIGWIIVRMTRMVRERDAALAAAREQALRDERVMAMGTLAAGAAHELGTPLATMNLIAGDLAVDERLPAGVREDVELLRHQIGVCKEIITGLSRRAGAERLENAPLEAADRWLDKLRQHWHAARPQTGSRLVIASDGASPEIIADARLEQAVLNLLNNAANATSSPLELKLSWCSSDVCIDIRDRGPGFPPAVLELAGQASLPAHPGGSGIGLLLTRAAIEQLGGRLTLMNPDDGGALARIEIPRKRS